MERAREASARSDEAYAEAARVESMLEAIGIKCAPHCGANGYTGGIVLNQENAAKLLALLAEVPRG